MRLVESGGVLFDAPHDSTHALVALSGGARWGPRLGRRYFCRSLVTHGTILTRIRAKTTPWELPHNAFGLG